MERRHSDSDPGEENAQFVNSVNAQNDSVKVMAMFLLYSMAMFSIPFLAFFGVKYTLKHSFNVEGFANTAWSVVAAVVVVNVIILAYACKGYEEVKEDERNEQSTSHEKKDKSDLNSKKTK